MGTSTPHVPRVVTPSRPRSGRGRSACRTWCSEHSPRPHRTSCGSATQLRSVIAWRGSWPLREPGLVTASGSPRAPHPALSEPTDSDHAHRWIEAECPPPRRYDSSTAPGCPETPFVGREKSLAGPSTYPPELRQRMQSAPVSVTYAASWDPRHSAHCDASRIKRWPCRRPENGRSDR